VNPPYIFKRNGQISYHKLFKIECLRSYNNVLSKGIRRVEENISPTLIKENQFVNGQAHVYQPLRSLAQQAPQNAPSPRRVRQRFAGCFSILRNIYAEH